MWLPSFLKRLWQVLFLDLSKEIVFITDSSASYELGVPDEDGYRDVYRNGSFHSRGRIAGSGFVTWFGAPVVERRGAIMPGYRLIIVKQDNEPHKYWVTTKVVSVKNK